MTNTIHNLDEGVRESFDFIIKGYTYTFTHLTTEELSKLKEIGEDEKKLREYLGNFIKPVDPKSPSFSKISSEMISPHWIKFRKMIESEMHG